ncbi:TPA: glycosyltransferase family 8 protein [Streptococcus suis]
MNILFTLNDAFVPQVAACMESIMRTLSKDDTCHFYLFSDGISLQNKEKLYQFVTDRGNKLTIIELENLESYFDFEIDTNGWASVVLARLLVDKLLPKEVDRIIYLDGDTLVLENIRELWEIDLEGNVLGMCPEPTASTERREKLGLRMNMYHNSGVLLIDLEQWRVREIGKKIFHYYRVNDGKLFAPDQDALNGALKDEIKTLSITYNYFNIFDVYPYRTLEKLSSPSTFISKEEFVKIRKQPCIVHFLGEERPWRIGNKHRFRAEYVSALIQTPWRDTQFESGWQFYFFCFNLFNIIMKPFPMLRYHIITVLIPVFMKHRKTRLQKGV